MNRFTIARAAGLVVLFATIGCTEPELDPNVAPVDGTYSLSVQQFVNGPIDSTTRDVTFMDSDVYILSGGSWSRHYSASSVSADGTRAPLAGAVSGSYSRSLRELTFHDVGQLGRPDLAGSFDGSSIVITDGRYIYTYSRSRAR